MPEFHLAIESCTVAGAERVVGRGAIVVAADDDLQQLQDGIAAALGLSGVTFNFFDEGFGEWCAPSSSLQDMPASTADDPVQIRVSAVANLQQRAGRRIMPMVSRNNSIKGLETNKKLSRVSSLDSAFRTRPHRGPLLVPVLAALCAGSPTSTSPRTPRTPAQPSSQEVGAGLLQACALGRVPIVDAVIRRERANPAFADERGYTCVHIAAQYGHTDVLRLVLETHGLRERGLLNAPTKDGGNTPLHLAAANDQPAAMRVLLLAGAERQAVNVDGDTPANAATKALGTTRAQPVLATLLHYASTELGKMDADAKARWAAQHGGDVGPQVVDAGGSGARHLVHKEDPTTAPKIVGGDEVIVRHRGRRGKATAPTGPPRRPARYKGDL